MLITEIHKEGSVVAVMDESVWVDLRCDDDKCGGCKISGICGRNVSSAITVKATNPHNITISVGDRVQVTGIINNWLAGWMLFAGLPCLAILATIISCQILHLPEITTGLLAIAALAVYYMVLWLCRKKIEKRVVWEITKTSI